jgi:hypothetical protein
MEIRTTVKDFSEKIKSYHFPPETCLHIIIDADVNVKNDTGKCGMLPFTTPEKQRYLLDLIPGEYYSDASSELVAIIESSHLNTDLPNIK